MEKPDTASITSFECRSFLDSIQNEYEQKQRDSIVSKLQEDLSELIAQRNILAKRKDFNEKYCVLCCSTFNLLFKRKVCCQDCHFWICRSCALWDSSLKQWLCNVCEKQRVLDAESQSWIYSRIKDYFGNFGAAKVLQNFCRLKKLADSENDSGYGTANDFMPLMKLLSSNSLNKDLKMAGAPSHDEGCEDDEDDIGDEEELAEIHHSIETILEGLLGGTLDDACVDHLFPNSSIYLELFSKYHIKLVGAIQNLSRALQKALHNLPVGNGITPTTAHAALKSIITTLVDECQNLPLIQHSESRESIPNSSYSYQFADLFSSYDSLVAAAVINKVVEESQTKFKNSFNSFEAAYEIQKEKSGSINDFQESSINQDVDIDTTQLEMSEFGLPVECVKIEEIEEITHEYTDSEDDKLSSISKWSNSVQSVEDLSTQKPPEIDLLSGIDLLCDAPIPFPEFGCDLVDNLEDQNDNVTCLPTSVTSWEENWLFRKKKRLPLYSNLKYQLLTYCEEPPCMLIPYPSETSDFVERDELSSELSETHSAGSLEFSSDSDEGKCHVEEALKPGAAPPPVAHSKSFQEAPAAQPSPVVVCNKNEISEKDSDKCHVKEMKPEVVVVVRQEENKQSLPPKQNVSEKNLPQKSVKLTDTSNKNTIQEQTPCAATPPRPGTIAEREHKKWLNAAPLKNNPYSAENISKRYTSRKERILKEHTSSFEEFERKLSVSSATSDPALNRLNCGPKSIDSELYKRDYYVNQDSRHFENSYPLNKSAKRTYSYSDDCFDLLSEEALNSFEEKVYVSSGKVFTLENHIKSLERELNNLSPTFDLKHHKPLQNRRESQDNPESNTNNNKTDVNKVKKNRPCMKVHSLTARSLSREFRDLAKQNLPKPMNRTISVSANCEEVASERESLCSPESAQSSFSAHPADNGHGYTSDESNTSTNSIPRTRTRQHISRAILERANYWERRAEQGLLSDASVSEEFPAIDIHPK